MDTTTDPVALAECMAPLDDESRWALYRHWERMVWQEWVPPVERRSRPVPWREATPRERRVARRAVARIAAASGLAQVVALPTRAAAAAGSAVAA